MTVADRHPSCSVPELAHEVLVDSVSELLKVVRTAHFDDCSNDRWYFKTDYKPTLEASDQLETAEDCLDKA